MAVPMPFWLPKTVEHIALWGQGFVFLGVCSGNCPFMLSPGSILLSWLISLFYPVLSYPWV